MCNCIMCRYALLLFDMVCYALLLCVSPFVLLVLCLLVVAAVFVLFVGTFVMCSLYLDDVPLRVATV